MKRSERTGGRRAGSTAGGRSLTYLLSQAEAEPLLDRVRPSASRQAGSD